MLKCTQGFFFIERRYVTVIKYKVTLEKIEQDDINPSLVTIDTSDLNSMSNVIELDYGEDFSNQVEFTNYVIIAGYIKDIIVSEINKLKEAMEEEKIKEEQKEEGEVILSDKPRVSERDVIERIRESHDIHGYINSIELNGEELSKGEASKFSFTTLNKIIVSGTKQKDETLFSDTLDMHYKIYFDSHIIERKNGEYTITKLKEQETLES